MTGRADLGFRRSSHRQIPLHRLAERSGSDHVIFMKFKGRKVVEKGGAFTLGEPMSDYGLYSGPENNPIVPENRYLWNVF